MLTAGSACGAGGDPAGDVGAGEPDRRYEGSFTVLESADHGPELCVDIAASMPPQCRGLPVVGWDWEAVAHEETVGGTTWRAGHVIGTYDGERLTLTEPPGPPEPDGEAETDHDFSPACDEPDVVDPSHGVAEWEAMSQDRGPFEIPGLVAAWVSDPAGDGSPSGWRTRRRPPTRSDDGVTWSSSTACPGRRDALVVAASAD